MHCIGKEIQAFENTPKKAKCPNCGKRRKLMVRS
jgi:rubredoxin